MTEIIKHKFVLRAVGVKIQNATPGTKFFPWLVGTPPNLFRTPTWRTKGSLGPLLKFLLKTLYLMIKCKQWRRQESRRACYNLSVWMSGADPARLWGGCSCHGATPDSPLCGTRHTGRADATGQPSEDWCTLDLPAGGAQDGRSTARAGTTRWVVDRWVEWSADR